MPGQEKGRVPYIYPMAGSTELPHMEEEGSLDPWDCGILSDLFTLKKENDDNSSAPWRHQRKAMSLSCVWVYFPGARMIPSSLSVLSGHQ